MEILALIKCSLLWSLSETVVQPAAAVPFNPAKLILLIGWVYLCLYFVQRVQFSPLVPEKFKSAAKIAAIFLGPLILFILLIKDTIKRLSEEEDIGEILKQQLKSLDPSRFFDWRKEPTITLLDSTGTDLSKIYNPGKTSRQTSRILQLTRKIITDAIEQRTSDILIDPNEDSNYTVRFRVDGLLRTIKEHQHDTCKAIINSIKAVSSMDIAEKRRAQDGAFIAKTPDGIVSFRVATAGTRNGEKVSIRILNKDIGLFRLDNIGLTAKQQIIIANTIEKPSGMVLVCGPTGCGKTTTLYGMLSEIDFFTRNIITVEDPVEYILPNTSQIEINPKAGITFASSLRNILRQDPDVICVGEIRDEETAKIALRAAQTGQLILATIHSNSTAGALIRLLDLGVTPLLLSAGLNLIVSLRLVRKLCNNCKTPAEVTAIQGHEFRKRGINYRNIFQAAEYGCDQCGETGYHGRTAIFDILLIDEKLRDNITGNRLSIAQLRKEGDKRGKSNLQKQGLKTVVSGITSFEELKRVLGQ